MNKYRISFMVQLFQDNPGTNWQQSPMAMETVEGEGPNVHASLSDLRRVTSGD